MGISYDSVEVLKGFAEKNKITFALLSDPQSSVIDAYGVRNKQASGKLDGVPHPTTFVVGQDMVVEAKLLGDTRNRHTTQELVEELRKL